jgi:Peptidase inhibitor family I36
MKSTSAWFGLFLLVMVLLSSAGPVRAQDRYDRDRDNRDDSDRRSGACFYKDADFRGEKFCVNAGERMAQVPPGFNDQISSIRIFGRTEITVYHGRDFAEPSLRLRNDVANLQTYQVKPGHSWNDRLSSIEVASLRDSGDWDHDGACFFKDADFRGEKFCVQKGDRMAQVPSGFGDKISSVRLYGRVTVTVYQDANFGGHTLRLQDDVANLQSYQVKPGHSWNDRISSVQVH